MKIASSFNKDINLFENKLSAPHTNQVQKPQASKDVELNISNEGLDELRKSAQKLMPDIDTSKEVLWTVENTNEVEFEHYMTMRHLCSEKYESIRKNENREEDINDVMKSIMETYETLYLNIVDAHKDGDREANYKLSGKEHISLEKDLDGLNKAYNRFLSDLQGYITCLQSNKQFSTSGMRGEIDSYFRRMGLPEPQFSKAHIQDYDPSYNYFDKSYNDSVNSIMIDARNSFLGMVHSSNYSKGMGLSHLIKLMNSNVKFIEGTKKLFS